MEIGGNFNLHIDFLYNSHYFDGCEYTFLNSGRACIAQISQAIGPGTILLPSYICPSMTHWRQNIVYYPMKPELPLQIDYEWVEAYITNNSIAAILMVHYFGVIDPKIKKIQHLCITRNIKLIEDITHSWLEDNQVFGDIQLCSLRKTLPLPDGAFMRGCTIKTQPKYQYYYFYILKILAMLLKCMTWLKFIWYPIFIKLEMLMDRYNQEMTWITFWLINRLDIHAIKMQRRANYNYLLNKLGNIALYKIPDLTFGFPIILEDSFTRNKLRQTLICEKIYPPIHWTLPTVTMCENARWVSDRILTIPIDQRYNLKHMQKIIDVINEGGYNQGNSGIGFSPGIKISQFKINPLFT